MTDRKKQIEEMAEDINSMSERNAHYYEKENDKLVQREAFADCKAIAEELVKKGWVKIPEDAVVLTKEEWENYKSSFRNQLYCKDVQYGIEIKELRNDRDYWREEYRQASKETKKTAEKILNELNRMVNKNAIKVNRDDYECGGFIYMIDCGDIALWLTEREKQYGVEIKE